MEEELKAVKTSTARKPKSQGITKGRSTKKAIRKRHKICRQLVSTISNTPTTKEEFLAKYKEELRQAGVDPIPSLQTLSNDIKKCKITFEHGSAQVSSKDTKFDSLGWDIDSFLRQIRLLYATYDITLLNTDLTPTLYPKTKEEFLSPLSILNFTENDQKKLPSGHFIYLNFILNRKGLEHVIEDTFSRDYKEPSYFLYIETHSYCTTIVFESQNLNIIMDKTFEIISAYPPD